MIVSTYSLYALSEGILPADVCGCSRKPISSRSAISLRIVALDRLNSGFLLTARDPTGEADMTYSSMIA